MCRPPVTIPDRRQTQARLKGALRCLTPTYGTKRMTPARVPKSIACGTCRRAQAQPDGHPESQVDRKLRDKESREPLTGIVQRESCRAYIGRANEPDEAVAERFMLEQHENEDEQHDPHGLD